MSFRDHSIVRIDYTNNTLAKSNVNVLIGRQRCIRGAIYIEFEINEMQNAIF